MILFITALVFVFILGYLAQTTGLCLVRGVNEAVAGKPLFLLAILFSGSFAWVSVLIAHYFDFPIPFKSYDVTALAIAGGLLFGLGAAFNNGCGVSTISKLARGQFTMLTTIVGWLLGWVLLAELLPESQPARFSMPTEWHYASLLVLSIAVLIFVSCLAKAERKIWLAMLTIGLMAGVAFLYEVRWTPSGLLKDISLSVWTSNQTSWPSRERFMLITALLGGMMVAALWSRKFSFALSNWRMHSRHLAAGVLMGFGAAIASGGNDSQLLLALPSLSPAGFATVFSILVGIYLGRRIA